MRHRCHCPPASVGDSLRDNPADQGSTIPHGETVVISVEWWSDPPTMVSEGPKTLPVGRQQQSKSGKQKTNAQSC